MIPWENNPSAGCLFNPNATAEEDPCLAQWLVGYGPYGQASAPIFMLMQTDEAETSDSDLIVFGGASTVFDGHFPGWSRARWPPEAFFWAIVDMQSAEQAGYVKLRSSNPRHTPEIHLDFYPEGSDSDIRGLVQGVERLLGILNVTGEPYQPFEIVQPSPELSIEQNIRDHTWSHHVTSSCRMGPADNRDYCVDSKFRVQGVRGLRVVDGSVFPISPGGFPASATATVSRKAFYDILEEAKGK
jgi:choline dehydrogenase